MGYSVWNLLRISLLLFALSFIIARSCTPTAEGGEVRRAVTSAAKRYNIDPKLVQAIILVESGGNPKAVGASHGEVGLMQLRPEYFPDASFDVQANIFIGVKYLAELRRVREKDFGCAWFVSYNVGPGFPLKYPKLHSYFKKILAVYPEVCGRRTREGV